MKKTIPLLILLIISVITCACVNTVAVHKLNEIASECMEKDDVQCAISRLESSVDLDPSIYESRYNLAVSYVKAGKCEEALKQLDEAQKLDDTQGSLYYTLGIANNCVADSFKYRKNEDGIEEKIVFDNEEDKAQAQESYINYLTAANNAFEKYLQSKDSNTNRDEVQYLIETNKQIINGDIGDDVTE